MLFFIILFMPLVIYHLLNRVLKDNRRKIILYQPILLLGTYGLYFLRLKQDAVTIVLGFYAGIGIWIFVLIIKAVRIFLGEKYDGIEIIAIIMSIVYFVLPFLISL